jgi:hypothetical protein
MALARADSDDLHALFDQIANGLRARRRNALEPHGYAGRCFRSTFWFCDCSMTALSADILMKPAEAPAEGGDALSYIFHSGKLAFQLGRGLSVNPFVRGSASANVWAGGWHAAKRYSQRSFVLAALDKGTLRRAPRKLAG